MTASKYCERSDVFDQGLPRGSLPNPARLVSAVSTSTGILTLDGHDFGEDAELVFRAEEGGELPPELVAGTTYYAEPLTDSTFKVRAVAAGSALTLSQAGSMIAVATPLPIDKWIEWASGIVDDCLPAHAVPLTAPYPVTVVTVAATLAAQKGLAYTGQATTSIDALIKWAQETIARWVKTGATIRGPIVPPSTNLAVKGSTKQADPRGWEPTGGSLP